MIKSGRAGWTAARRPVCLRLPQHDAEWRLLSRSRGDYAGFAEAKLERSIPGPRRCSWCCAAAIRIRIRAARWRWRSSTARRWPARCDRVLAGRLKPVSGPLRVSYVITSLPFAPQQRAEYEADLANPKAFAVRRARRCPRDARSPGARDVLTRCRRFASART